MGGFTVVDVGRLDDHGEGADRSVEFGRHLVLDPRQFQKVGVSLRPEINTVGVDHKVQRAIAQKVIQQADARDVGRVTQRLQRRNRGRTTERVAAQPLYHPTHLIETGAGVVAEPSGVAGGVAELGHFVEVREVRAHPRDTIRIGEAFDYVVSGLGAAHDEGGHQYFAHGQSVVRARDAGFHD